MKIQGPWIWGDGGPSLVINKALSKNWQGTSDFENSIMGGGDLETHYDLACSGSDWLNVIDSDGMIAISLGGDETTAAWMVAGDEIGIIRPLYLINTAAYDAPDSELYKESKYLNSLDFMMKSDSYLLQMAADCGPDYGYGTSEIVIPYAVSKIETREFQDEENHIVFHVFKR